MNELISVIIPIYNVERYLEKSIESVIGQSYKNLEIILVDDGSTDESGKMCDEIAKKDKRIKVIHKKNGGLSDARNAGIEVAKGKYLGFIDSDDYIDKYFYETLYTVLKKYNADISMCNYKKVYTDFEENNAKLEHKEQVFNSKQALRELLLFGKIENYAWNKLYRKELFEKVRYPVGKKMEDIGTTYLTIKNSKTVVVTDYIGYFYRQRKGSIMSDGNPNLIRDTRDMVNKRYNDLIKTDKDLISELNINRLTFIKYYFEDIGKLKDKSILSEFKNEHKFYKEHYKTYKKEIKKTTVSKIKRIDFNILYYSDKLLVYIYAIKKQIKKLIRR